MKTFKIFSITILLMTITLVSFAQKSQSETIAVSGNCGMCKSSIEKAAKKAGATTADWNVDSKVLTVSYASNTSSAKIQQAVAAVGYDTKDVKATDAAYDKLHACCKYDREKKNEITTADKKDKSSCCSKEEAGKEGKEKDKSCCNDH